MPSATLGLLFGVWLFQQQAVVWAWPTLLALGVGVLTAVVAVPWLKARDAIPILLACARHIRLILCVALCGFVMAQSRAWWRLSEALPIACQQQPLVVQAVITGVPEQDALGQHVDALIEGHFSTACTVPRHVRLHLYQSGYRQAVAPKPIMQTPQQAVISPPLPPPKSSPQLAAGERWQFTVRFKRPHATRNPHGFDYAAWCLANHIGAMGTIVNKAPMRKLQPFVWRLDTIIARGRVLVGARIARVLGRTPESAVIRALVIGDDSQIRRADWQLFVDSGINHLISISGLHITMLASLGYLSVMGVWRLRPRWGLYLPSRIAATLGGSMVAIGYAALAGFSIPTQRTLFMLLTVAFMLYLQRPLPFLWIVCAALWVVLCIDPWSVLAPGFWLSFGAVAVLSMAMGGRLGVAKWWQQAWQSQWVMTLAFVPVLISLFNQVSLVSPLANAIAIPVVSLAVVPLAMMGALLPMDVPLQWASWLLSRCMDLLHWLHGVDMPVWFQATPPAWALVLAMVGVLVCLMPRGLPLRWAGLLCCLPLALPTAKPLSHGQMRVHVLDVGQGLSVLVQTAQHALLYDAGPRYGTESDAGQRIVLPYLRHLGVGALDMVVISHDDSDHVGGMLSVVNGVVVQRILSSLTPQATLFSEMQALPNLHIGPSIACHTGQRWVWDGVVFDILAPTHDWAFNQKDNEKSCVLKVTSAHGSILLTGDIERQAEQWLVDHAAQALASTVMTIPHHGSKTSSTLPFVQAVQPRIAIATLGYLNRFGHPKPEVMARYQAIHAQMYRSDQHGALLLSFESGQQPNVTPWRQVDPHYWETPAW